MAGLTVGLFDSLKKLTPHTHEQLLVLAAAFVLLIEVTRQNAFDVFVTVKNLMADRVHSERRKSQFAALKMHIEEDLLDAR